MPQPRGKRDTKRTKSNAPAIPETLVTIVSEETQTAIQAILVGPRGWKRESRRAPMFGNEDGTFVSLGDPTRKLSLDDEEQAWKRVLSLDDQTAQTFVFVAAAYLAENDDPKVRRPVRIHVNQLLDYRGYGRQTKGDFKRSYKLQERERLANLAAMHVSTTIAERGRKNARMESNLLHVTYYTEEDGKQQALTFLDGADAGRVPYGFDIMLGDWAANAVDRAGHKRALLAHIMKYDTRDPEQRMAMRLGLYLHFRPSSVTTVRDLLEGANIPRPAHHPEDFRDSYENAMDRLASDGIVGAWHYVEETELPRYRWLDLWLGWEVAIKQAPNVIVSSTSNALRLPLTK